jgi:lipopolysaccharide/colanic/teichoic acid biosynthesis glycosyltransferase
MGLHDDVRFATRAHSPTGTGVPMPDGPSGDVATLATRPALFSHNLANPLSRSARFFKRAFDLVLASASLIVALPVLVVAVIAIRADSRGRAVFKQLRLGASGREFVMYKLRTMTVDNDESLHQAYIEALITGEAEPLDGAFKLMADPRVTTVGRVLRRLSIDELPQLWNILKGDMSLIGPRPALPREAALYDARAWQRVRTKPGLTGLWQVNGRCEVSFEEMLRNDLLYGDTWTPWLDIKILLRTPGAVLSRRGAR